MDTRETKYVAVIIFMVLVMVTMGGVIYNQGNTIDSCNEVLRNINPSVWGIN